MSYLLVTKRIIVGGLLLSIFAASVLSAAQGEGKKPVVFKSPSGYMPAELSGHLGKLFLDPKKPGGMFVGYPKDGQDMASFTDEMKKMVAGMFLHDEKNPAWDSASLPPHKGIDTEMGTLMTTSNGEMEVQLAFYSRPEGVAYGYFAMRHKKPKSDDAKFLDSSGAGVKAFDELAKTISSNPR